MALKPLKVGEQPFLAQPIRAAPISSYDSPSYQRLQEKKQRITNIKILGSGGIIATLVAFAFKNGLNGGFKNLATVLNSISNLVSLPFALSYPIGALESERASRRGEQKGTDDLFMRGLYTAASVAFAPNTVGGPANEMTKSTAHMVTGLLNLPHWLFCLFSYTIARLLSFIKVAQKKVNVDEERQYRLGQEFEALYKLGNIGSSQVSVIPMASQCATGLQTLKDIVTGNFGSAWDRFKKEPVTVALGTAFNWWAWPFEYVAKFLDTTIRATENVEQFENAFPTNSRLIKILKDGRNWWHSTAKENSPLGKFLKYGRELSKIEALLLPPIGMVSVVWPTMNKFLRGEFWNKEAQGIDGVFGGLIGLADKVFNTVAFFSHVFYTGAYGLFVRLPQTISTATFYACHAINKFTGRKLEPNEIRKKIFEGGIFQKISNWAAKKLDEGELEVHKDAPILINDVKDKDGNIIKKGTGRCRHIRNFIEILAEETYKPLRENYYGFVVAASDNKKPSDLEWGKALKGVKSNILTESEAKLTQYLSNSAQLDKAQIEEFKERGYLKTIKEEIEHLIDNEIKESINPKITPEAEQKIKSKSIFELLRNPKDLKEVLRGKMFHATNSILPLWVSGFVNALDMGEKDEPYWLRNLKATTTGINELDIVQACNRELMPVVAYAFQSAGKGMALTYNLGRLIFKGEPLPSSTDYGQAA